MTYLTVRTLSAILAARIILHRSHERDLTTKRIGHHLAFPRRHCHDRIAIEAGAARREHSGSAKGKEKSLHRGDRRQGERPFLPPSADIVSAVVALVACTAVPERGGGVVHRAEDCIDAEKHPANLCSRTTLFHQEPADSW